MAFLAVFWSNTGMCEQNGAPLNQPCKPDLRCQEHGSVCEVVHAMYSRLLIVEAKIESLEQRISSDKLDKLGD